MAQQPDINMAEVLARMLGSRDDEKKVPRWNNPAKYARHCLIEDVEALSLSAAMDALKDELDVLYRRARSKSALLESKKQELFLRLSEVYPQIDRRAEGTGIRTWKEQQYYVAWDEVEEGDDADAEKPGYRGQYL